MSSMPMRCRPERCDLLGSLVLSGLAELNDLARMSAQYLRRTRRKRAAESATIMSGHQDYRDLDAWQVAMALVERFTRLHAAVPDSERYGLISQMRRASYRFHRISRKVRPRNGAFGLHFVRIAIGSAAELDTQLELARRLRFVTHDATRELDRQLERVRQMLYGMRREHPTAAPPERRSARSLLLSLCATVCCVDRSRVPAEPSRQFHRLDIGHRPSNIGHRPSIHRSSVIGPRYTDTTPQ